MKKELYPQKCPICQDWVELIDMVFCEKNNDHYFCINNINYTYYHIKLIKENILFTFSVGNNSFVMHNSLDIYQVGPSIYQDKEELTWDMVGEKIKKLMKMRILL